MIFLFNIFYDNSILCVLFWLVLHPMQYFLTTFLLSQSNSLKDEEERRSIKIRNKQTKKEHKYYVKI